MLNEDNNSHINIKLVCQLDTTISFLDVFIENKNGILATPVYRKEAADPYIVTFKSDHSRHVFVNIINGALMRAMRYTSSLSTFDEERRSIKLIYPPRYIYNAFTKFFTNNIHISSIIPFIDNEQYFMFIRGYLLNKPTATEHQIASRIAKTVDPNNNDSMNDPLVQMG